MASSELEIAIENLWRTTRPPNGNLYAAPAFSALRRVLQARYPAAGSESSFNFAISQALYNLGYRWAEEKPSERAATARVAADKLDSAFRQVRATRTHLCPLDGADLLPPRQFGTSVIQRFPATELDKIVDPHGIGSNLLDLRFDSQTFSQFSWLVVKENIELPGEPGERALPFLYDFIGKDFGRIEPHRSIYPPAVELAIFAILMAPWEEITAHSEIEWRPFRIPWVYSSDDDLFAMLPRPPNAETLSWDIAHYQNESGEWIEYECPASRYLENDADEKTKFLDETFWTKIETACRSPLFETPVKHFFVRAFNTAGIDEFLAHILVIEAALGLPDDYRRKPKLEGDPGATARVAARLACLLNDPTAEAMYKKLFDQRSGFLHGRAVPDISSGVRLDARRLARRCVSALLDEATSAHETIVRDDFLNDLLDRGWSAK